MNYQDIWIRGQVEAKGERECESRWATVREVLAQREQPFTLLDIGAAEGYFSFRAASGFDCVAVMLQSDESGCLRSLCERNALPGTVLLNHRATVEDLETLAQCEHFDVVLALNVLHHFDGADPARLVKAVLSLGTRVIVETPPASDVGACGQAVIPALEAELARRSGTNIGRHRSHTAEVDRSMLLFESEPRALTRPYLDAPDTERCDVVRGGAGWCAGINVRTYQMLGGAWPERQEIAAKVKAPGKPHGDIRPWNLILGRGVHLIDGGDSKAIYRDAESLEATVEDILSDSPMGAHEWQAKAAGLVRDRSLVILTPFRNARAQLRRYFRQLESLRSVLPPGLRLRLVAAEGDSLDGSREAIRRMAAASGIDCDLVACDHGGNRWASVESPDRMRAMSKVMNAALGAVSEDDDLALWIMCDLDWSASDMASLIRAAAEGRGGFDVFAPMSYLTDGRFYDTWAYRAQGERFSPFDPHCEGWKAGELFEVDSAGTCLAMRAETARAIRATDNEAVSWCAAARKAGHRIAVSDRWRVTHADRPARRLLFVGDAVAPTGFSRCTHAALPALAEAGWDIDVVGINYWGIPHNYPHRIWPAAVQDRWPFGELRMMKLLQSEKFDAVVILQDPWNIPNYMKGLEEVEDCPPVIGWIAVDAKNQQGEALNGLDHVVTWTDFAAEELKAGGYEGEPSVVPLGVAHRYFQPLDKAKCRAAIWPKSLPSDAFIVGSVGRNQLRKRYDLMLAGFAEWEDRPENAYLYLRVLPSGGGGSYDIESLVRYYGLQGKVAIHAETIAEEQLAAYYGTLDLYLTTTQGEGWGLPVLEAMAAGVPVIAPDFSGLGCWAKDAAHLIPCSGTAPSAPLNGALHTLGGVVSPSEVAGALRLLYGSADRRELLRKRGLRLASGLSWGRTGREFAEVVESVVSASAAKREVAGGG